jgi:hypothetical protein
MNEQIEKEKKFLEGELQKVREIISKAMQQEQRIIGGLQLLERMATVADPGIVTQASTPGVVMPAAVDGSPLKT